MPKILTRCPECAGNGINCSRCKGSGVVEIDACPPAPTFDPIFESAANDALAKKCDELTKKLEKIEKTVRPYRRHPESVEETCAGLVAARDAFSTERENLRQSCADRDRHIVALVKRRDELETEIIRDYMIEGDDTLRDVCTRLTHANVELSKKLAAAREWYDTQLKLLVEERDKYVTKATELTVIRAMFKERVPVGQSTEYLDERDGCGSAVSALLSAYDELDNNIKRLVKERDEQQIKRYAAEAEIDRLKADDPEGIRIALRHQTAVTSPVASAAERAAGKVSGPAQAALVALAVELRRGT